MRKTLALCGLLLVAASCQKNSSSNQSATQNTTSISPVSVATLKTYLANLTHVNVDQIGYNSTSQKFTAFGKDQISLASLSQSYYTLPIRNLGKHGPKSLMALPPPGTGGGGGGGTTPPPTPPTTPAPTPAPFTDPADSLLSYSNNLLNYNATSATIAAGATTDYTDVTQGAVISYSIAVTGSSGGSISGSTLNVKYNQSQTVKVTVQISVPHDPVTNAVKNFTVNATLELFTGNILTPSGIPGYGISLTQKNVKATDVIVTETFNFTFPVATASLNGTHFCMYWNNATSAADEKIILEPVYAIAVQGLPTTSGNPPVTEQTGPQVYLYRMFDSPGGEHFYTVSNIEKQQLLDQTHQYFPPSFWSFLINQITGGSNTPPNNWTYEGNIGHIWNYQAEGTVPLYRLYNGSVHMYTIDPNERDNIINTLGYKSEGITGYVFSVQVAGSQPVYRYNGVKSKGHFFTKNYNEIGNGTAAGFAYEGIAYYDLP